MGHIHGDSDRRCTAPPRIAVSSGRVAQWESARLTRERSLVRNQPRPCWKLLESASYSLGLGTRSAPSNKRTRRPRVPLLGIVGALNTRACGCAAVRRRRKSLQIAVLHMVSTSDRLFAVRDAPQARERAAATTPWARDRNLGTVGLERGIDFRRLHWFESRNLNRRSPPMGARP